jgi:hypothetical protein
LENGKWQQISLATIIDPKAEYDQTYLKILQRKYLKFLSEVPDDVRENTLRYLNFLSDQFSKYVANGNNHEYLISSKLTEIFVNTSMYDGVIYPSV